MSRKDSPGRPRLDVHVSHAVRDLVIRASRSAGLSMAAWMRTRLEAAAERELDAAIVRDRRRPEPRRSVRSTQDPQV